MLKDSEKLIQIEALIQKAGEDYETEREFISLRVVIGLIDSICKGTVNYDSETQTAEITEKDRLELSVRGEA